MVVSKTDFHLVKEIEKALLIPRPVFRSPAEFAFHLADRIEKVVRAREEIAFQQGKVAALMELKELEQV